ncbi:MAG: type III secretion system chaperone [Desulfobacter sp.]|nr:type III secretion system chaperone [Desulfobacter sp.]WDP84782.1 MAG: type III secretion system chaperone [Desulfobacter sp.]
MDFIDKIISGFGTMVGLSDLALDDGNCCTLQFDQVIVNVEYLPDTRVFYFYTRIGAIPANKEVRLQIFEYLLESNCFYRKAHGGVLGIDGEQDAVIYTHKFNADDLDAKIFGDYMEAFVNTAETFAGDLLDESGDKSNAMPPMGGLRV